MGPCRSVIRPAAAAPTAYPSEVVAASRVITVPSREAGVTRSALEYRVIM